MTTLALAVTLKKWLRKVGCLKRLQTWAGFIAGLSRSNFTSQFPTIPKHLNLTLSQRRIRKHFMISALIRAGSLLAPQLSCRFFIMSGRIPRLSRRMLSWRYRLFMLPQRKVSYRHILPCSWLHYWMVDCSYLGSWVTQSKHCPVHPVCFPASRFSYLR